MELSRNGVTIQVDDGVVMRMIVERLSTGQIPSPAYNTTVQCIGDIWLSEGGIYAGVMRGRDGGPDYHLIVGPEYDGALQFQPAMEWATGLEVDSRKDFTLPYRNEQALLFANVPELFRREYYWSREQPAEDADYAWGQNFGYGFQTYWYKGNGYRARAVRRVLL